MLRRVFKQGEKRILAQNQFENQTYNNLHFTNILYIGVSINRFLFRKVFDALPLLEINIHSKLYLGHTTCPILTSNKVYISWNLYILLLLSLSKAPAKLRTPGALSYYCQHPILSNPIIVNIDSAIAITTLSLSNPTYC